MPGKTRVGRISKARSVKLSAVKSRQNYAARQFGQFSGRLNRNIFPLLTSTRSPSRDPSRRDWKSSTRSLVNPLSPPFFGTRHRASSRQPPLCMCASVTSVHVVFIVVASCGFGNYANPMTNPEPSGNIHPHQRGRARSDPIQGRFIFWWYVAPFVPSFRDFPSRWVDLALSCGWTSASCFSL